MEDKQTDEIIELQVDSELLERVHAITAQMGTTPETLATSFFEWCENPATRKEAIISLYLCPNTFMILLFTTISQKMNSPIVKPQPVFSRLRFYH